jgi:hypothetical protein
MGSQTSYHVEHLSENRLILYFRNKLSKYRKKYPRVHVVITHNVIPFYNPIRKDYQDFDSKPFEREIMCWFIQICVGANKVISRKYMLKGDYKFVENLLCKISI